MAALPDSPRVKQTSSRHVHVRMLLRLSKLRDVVYAPSLSDHMLPGESNVRSTSEATEGCNQQGKWGGGQRGAKSPIGPIGPMGPIRPISPTSWDKAGEDAAVPA